MSDPAKEFVNEIRRACKQRAVGKLKKGYRGSSLLCPVALSLESCGVYEATSEEDMVILFSHPSLQQWRAYERPEVAKWMRDYDAGKYPELVLPPTPIKIKYPGDRKATILFA